MVELSYRPGPEVVALLRLSDDELLARWKSCELGGHTTSAGDGKFNLHLYTRDESRQFVKKISDLDLADLE